MKNSIRKKFENFYNNTYVQYYASKIKEVLKDCIEESFMIVVIICSIFLILMLMLGVVCYISYFFSSENEQMVWMRTINSAAFQWEFIKWTVVLQIALYILFVLFFGDMEIKPFAYKYWIVGGIIFGVVLYQLWYRLCTGLYCLAATIFPNIKPFIWLVIFEASPIVIILVWQFVIDLKQFAIDLKNDLKKIRKVIEKILKSMREK